MVEVNLYRNDCRLVLDDIERDLQSQGKKIHHGV